MHAVQKGRAAGLFRRITSGLALAGVGGLALLVLCGALGARFNRTPSLAVGLYWSVDRPLEKGSYVMFCPPQTAIFDEARKRRYIGRGNCAGDYVPLIKRVLGMPGDVVAITAKEVSVNGVALPLSSSLQTDAAGNPMPQPALRNFTLGPAELLLMSDVNPKSFDGRYFGAIQRDRIRHVLRPVITW